jgi:hypothetical protein
MMQIPLTQGKVALVDDEDYERCREGPGWCALAMGGHSFYALRNAKKPDGSRTMEYLSRFILGVTDRKSDVDHINHETLDNRKENLRIVTKRQNQQNRRKPKSSKYPGVSWSASAKRWRAFILTNGVRKFLGNFKVERDAAVAYEHAVRATGEELVCKMRVSV